MRILLTGASGFLGRHVLAALGPGPEVIAVTKGSLRRVPAPNVTFVQTDLLKPDGMAGLVRRFRADTLVHLAWSISPGAFWTSPENILWRDASLALAREFVAQGGQRMVFAGSCAEYDWNAPMPLREESSPVKPHSLYGVCKDRLRQDVEAFSASSSVACLWCRIFWPYGPGEPPDKLVSWLIGRLLAGKRAVCRASNLQRDYIHVQDAARALAVAALSSMTGIVNVGQGEAVALGEVARLAARATGRPDLLELERIPVTAETPGTVVASTDRLTGELGWKPRWILAEGIADMVAAATAGEAR